MKPESSHLAHLNLDLEKFSLHFLVEDFDGKDYVREGEVRLNLIISKMRSSLR